MFFHQLAMWLAQLEQPDGGAVQQAAQQEAESGSSIFTFILPMMLALLVMMLLMRPRKTDTKHKERLKDLKKNDRVVTAGGILGTVISMREDTNYVTLRIDESTNTKLQILKSSIVKVIDDEEKKSD